MKKRLLSVLLVLCMMCTLIPISALAADGGSSVYLGFTSDVHDSVSALDSWEKNVNKAIEPDMDYMLFCGDYSYETGSAYLNVFKDVVNVTTENVKNGGIYTSGNHDYSDTGRILGGLRKEFTSTPGFLRIGEAVKTDSYIVYCFGTAWGNGIGSFSDSDILTLQRYLKTAPDDRPIFILSHYPLHYIESRMILNADKVIRLLNNYPNAVFVWGHNHSQSAETHYGEILASGDSIQYGLLSSAEINFTYVCAGVMKSGTKEPYDGLVAEINNGVVTFTYYNDAGKAVSTPRTVRSGSHCFTDYVYNNDATCTKDGTMTAKCDSCNKTDTIADPDHPRIDHVDKNGDFICDMCRSFEFTAEAKEAAAAEINELAGEKPSAAVKNTVNKALAAIENAESVAAVKAAKAKAVVDIKAQQDKEELNELLARLDEYLKTAGVFTRKLIETTVSLIEDNEDLIRYLIKVLD